MNGTWKENVGGYHKDCKRKKQSRKHTLKDKAKWHIRHSGIGYRNTIPKNTPTKIEGDVVITPRKILRKKELYVDVYVINVDDYNYIEILGEDFCVPPQGFFEGKTKIAFKYNNNYFDIYTKEIIIGLIKPLSKIDTIYLDWDEEDTYITERVYKPSIKETIFLYGKPLPKKYWNIFGFWTTKARKYAQNKAHRMDRRNTKTFIKKGDWDAEIKTHCLSKSIAWEIY